MDFVDVVNKAIARVFANGALAVVRFAKEVLQALSAALASDVVAGMKYNLRVLYEQVKADPRAWGLHLLQQRIAPMVALAASWVFLQSIGKFVSWLVRQANSVWKYLFGADLVSSDFLSVPGCTNISEGNKILWRDDKTGATYEFTNVKGRVEVSKACMGLLSSTKKSLEMVVAPGAVPEAHIDGVAPETRTATKWSAGSGVIKDVWTTAGAKTCGLVRTLSGYALVATRHGIGEDGKLSGAVLEGVCGERSFANFGSEHPLTKLARDGATIRNFCFDPDLRNTLTYAPTCTMSDLMVVALTPDQAKPVMEILGGYDELDLSASAEAFIASYYSSSSGRPLEKVGFGRFDVTKVAKTGGCSIHTVPAEAGQSGSFVKNRLTSKVVAMHLGTHKDYQRPDGTFAGNFCIPSAFLAQAVAMAHTQEREICIKVYEEGLKRFADDAGLTMVELIGHNSLSDAYNEMGRRKAAPGTLPDNSSTVPVYIPESLSEAKACRIVAESQVNHKMNMPTQVEMTKALEGTDIEIKHILRPETVQLLHEKLVSMTHAEELVKETESVAKSGGVDVKNKQRERRLRRRKKASKSETSDVSVPNEPDDGKVPEGSRGRGKPRFSKEEKAHFVATGLDTVVEEEPYDIDESKATGVQASAGKEAAWQKVFAATNAFSEWVAERIANEEDLPIHATEGLAAKAVSSIFDRLPTYGQRVREYWYDRHPVLNRSNWKDLYDRYRSGDTRKVPQAGVFDHTELERAGLHDATGGLEPDEVHLFPNPPGLDLDPGSFQSPLSQATLDEGSQETLPDEFYMAQFNGQTWVTYGSDNGVCTRVLSMRELQQLPSSGNNMCRLPDHVGPSIQPPMPPVFLPFAALGRTEEARYVSWTSDEDDRPAMSSVTERIKRGFDSWVSGFCDSLYYGGRSFFSAVGSCFKSGFDVVKSAFRSFTTACRLTTFWIGNAMCGRIYLPCSAEGCNPLDIRVCAKDAYARARIAITHELSDCLFDVLRSTAEKVEQTISRTPGVTSAVVGSVGVGLFQFAKRVTKNGMNEMYAMLRRPTICHFFFALFHFVLVFFLPPFVLGMLRSSHVVFVVALFNYSLYLMRNRMMVRDAEAYMLEKERHWAPGKTELHRDVFQYFSGTATEKLLKEVQDELEGDLLMSNLMPQLILSEIGAQLKKALLTKSTYDYRNVVSALLSRRATELMTLEGIEKIVKIHCVKQGRNFRDGVIPQSTADAASSGFYRGQTDVACKFCKRSQLSDESISATVNDRGDVTVNSVHKFGGSTTYVISAHQFPRGAKKPSAIRRAIGYSYASDHGQDDPLCLLAGVYCAKCSEPFQLFDDGRYGNRLARPIHRGIQCGPAADLGRIVSLAFEANERGDSPPFSIPIGLLIGQDEFPAFKHYSQLVLDQLDARVEGVRPLPYMRTVFKTAAKRYSGFNNVQDPGRKLAAESLGITDIDEYSVPTGSAEEHYKMLGTHATSRHNLPDIKCAYDPVVVSEWIDGLPVYQQENLFDVDVAANNLTRIHGEKSSGFDSITYKGANTKSQAYFAFEKASGISVSRLMLEMVIVFSLWNGDWSNTVAVAVLGGIVTPNIKNEPTPNRKECYRGVMNYSAIFVAFQYVVFGSLTAADKRNFSNGIGWGSTGLGMLGEPVETTKKILRRVKFSSLNGKADSIAQGDDSVVAVGGGVLETSDKSQYDVTYFADRYIAVAVACTHGASGPYAAAFRRIVTNLLLIVATALYHVGNGLYRLEDLGYWGSGLYITTYGNSQTSSLFNLHRPWCGTTHRWSEWCLGLGFKVRKVLVDSELIDFCSHDWDLTEGVAPALCRESIVKAIIRLVSAKKIHSDVVAGLMIATEGSHPPDRKLMTDFLEAVASHIFHEVKEWSRTRQLEAYRLLEW